MAAHQFDLDTRIEPLGEGRFGAEISERWWVGRGPNGGLVAALFMRAFEATVDPERAPRSLTIHFPRAPKAGPAELTVRVEREGGRATFLSARLEQAGEIQATAQALLSENWEAEGSSEFEMPSVEPPEELYEPDPAVVEGMPAMMQN